MIAASVPRIAILLATMLIPNHAVRASTDPLTDMLIESGLKSESELHPSIRALIDNQDYKLKSTFQVGRELVGFALSNEGVPSKSLLVYETSDGFLIHGEIRDPEGKAITEDHRGLHLPGVISKDSEGANATGFVISEGKGSVVLDVFLDPQCTYCKKLWGDLRRELDFVTVNWRPIAIFPGSLSQVSGLMQSADPVAALETLVRLGTTEQHPTTSAIVAGVRNNTQRMQKANMTQTPSGFLRLPNGQIQPFQGAAVIETIRSLRY